MSPLSLPQWKPPSVSLQTNTKSLQQQQSLSLILQQSSAPFHQIQSVAAPIFSGLSGYTISNFVVDVHQASAPVTQYDECEEFDKSIKHLNV